MALSLAFWSKGTVELVYINGIIGGAKAYFARRGSSVTLVAGGLDEDNLRRDVMEAFSLAEIDWDTLVEIGKRPAPRRGKPLHSAPVTYTVPASAGAGVWTAQDAEALNADAMANPIPEPVTLQVDHREPAELKERLRRIANIEVEELSLEVGDFVVPDVLTIERKTVADFVNSITSEDKRLFKQSDAMTRIAGSAVLLLEGDIYQQQRMSIPAITGALSYLAVIQGVAIVPTLSLPHSAYTIAKLIRHAKFGLGYSLSLRGVAPKHPGKAAAFLIEGLPGVSAHLAQALLRRFGSARGVASATLADLISVEGIGPKKAAAIFEALNTGPE